MGSTSSCSCREGCSGAIPVQNYDPDAATLVADDALLSAASSPSSPSKSNSASTGADEAAGPTLRGKASPSRMEAKEKGDIPALTAVAKASPKAVAAAVATTAPVAKTSLQSPPPKANAPGKLTLQQRRGLSITNIAVAPKPAAAAAAAAAENASLTPPVSQVALDIGAKKSPGLPGSPGSSGSWRSSGSSVVAQLQKQVLKLMEDERSPREMPLPGAFADKPTLFFFDWDDTLCPTSWIRTILRGRLTELDKWDDRANRIEDWCDSFPRWFHNVLPDEPLIRQKMSRLQKAAAEVIRVAQSFGVVVIVTNSFPGWVETTIKKWLPRLTQYVHGHGATQPSIKVLYGQSCYLKRAKNFAWVDDLKEHVFWKKDAMVQAMDDYASIYRLPSAEKGETSGTSWVGSHKHNPIHNVFSIGDSESEMQAAFLAAWSRRRQGSPTLRHSLRPWVKAVKLLDCPHVDELTMQLKDLAAVLPHLVPQRRHIRISCEISLGELQNSPKLKREGVGRCPPPSSYTSSGGMSGMSDPTVSQSQIPITPRSV